MFQIKYFKQVTCLFFLEGEVRFIAACSAVDSRIGRDQESNGRAQISRSVWEMQDK